MAVVIVSRPTLGMLAMGALGPPRGITRSNVTLPGWPMIRLAAPNVGTVMLMVVVVHGDVPTA
jgi:hypothetical protein